MLQTQTVRPETLVLIQKLSNDEQLKNFILVGGTALSLQIGHRISVDIDLFSSLPFDAKKISDYLARQYNTKLINTLTNGIFCYIDEVKVDLIAHQYKQIDALVIEQEIRMASLKEIGAMKLNAIVNSGSRLKDFVDMYTLLEHHSLKSMLDAYEQKYPQTNRQIATNALNYFEDIDEEIDSIRFIVTPPTIEQVKERLYNATLDQRKIFPDLQQAKKQKLTPEISEQERTLQQKRRQKQSRGPKRSM
ncbi:nucleotidyl transferase AbiEii/AbiGii toxin family protein [Arachidicoccus sp.]|uniref:nucleotidyl transferase AbiEii/AbiGii toxin family protein n=1 Tax=Arachidicoccus sp. TaxID=1872624 RepID=UPI003D1BAB53